MTETDRTAYSEDHDTGYFDSAARGDARVGTHSRSQSDGGQPSGSSAAERLGGPSESERAAASDERADAAPTDQARSGDSRSADGRSADNGAGAASGGTAGAGADVPERLIARDRAESYQARWKDIKGDFVDEPRRAVRGANELVGEVLDQLEELFRNQRSEIEKGLDSDEATTEDLRLALGKYRSFFDRLLSI